MADSERALAPVLENWEWQMVAACRGMDVELFFHPHQEGKRARRQRILAAKVICSTCPVAEMCLDHALQTREPYGIWGGRSETERADMLGLRSLRYPASAARQGCGDEFAGAADRCACR